MEEIQNYPQYPVQYHTHNGTDSPLISSGGSFITYVILGIQARQNSSYDIFFIAPRSITVSEVRVRYATANTGALTLDIVKCADGVAVASGTSILASTFDLDTTADTAQIKTLNAVIPAGTALGAKRTGAVNNILHVVIEVSFT